MTIGAIVIDHVRPSTPTGFTPKASEREVVPVSARIFRDGHDVLAARVRWRRKGDKQWRDAPLAAGENDFWHGWLTCDEVGTHTFVIEAWTDRFATWRKELRLKVAAGQEVDTELEEGALLLDALGDLVPRDDRDRLQDAVKTIRSEMCSLDVKLNAALDDALVPILAGVPHGNDLTASPKHALWVDRERARSSTWYEFFPRSEGGLRGSIDRLPAVAAMGFDVLYLPPIHPIGTTARKGRNNTLQPGPGDPGSPWAIGSADGGHTAIHPDLGTIDNFRALVAAAADLDLEIALDYALQCSPDHPWVSDHPEWFHHRPDGTIKYAENPPKKYQDIYPLNFWPADDADRVALWEACRDILRYWIGEGVRIFRVDNPHTKPLPFWEWAIAEIRADHPDTIYLAEAFTRPAMMAKLAEVGFSQSYTYFTWRTTKWELASYVEELAHGPLADFMRPNFWPNTPDILSGPLREGNRAAFLLRYLLAATLVPNVGLYSGYELCENTPASDTNEEYLYSEKYEVKDRDWGRADSLAPFITLVNGIRRRHPVALGSLRDVHFHHAEDDQVVAYSRGHHDRGDLVLVVVNLDPHNVRETLVHLDVHTVGLPGGPMTAHDELTGETYEWNGPVNYVRLDPHADRVGHVLDLHA